ncbi:sulfite exporter TauE/SafE family protein [Helcobacillus sp. ACRRO]|uniref:sulfite exporter TauE/SafE family protein n=1 Tax=Helcobacillus TaxID=1161125 RepID=UPI001EF46D16|nr:MULTISPECIES: sulfite exporter TauE/SafE family protein [Helcobacillus]MCG7427863.1 sulfite exporter TauE/SafE family protein [Helcobacillus sp. ACRRO]MDK7741673.1 sulfite exporter TauE/SafE family protein [Helcobacillus massiliensis]WOO92716.1 sulfite exporter TauE/SafE family protein [Helcobacillus massiliensis]
MVLPILLGLGIGLVVGALGAGGGILSVPVLVYLLAQDPHTAAAESLVIVGVTAIVGIIHHWRRGSVAVRDGLIFGGISLVGAVAGSRASALVPGQILLILFSALLMLVAVAMIRRGLETRRSENRRAAQARAHAAAEARADAAGESRAETSAEAEQRTEATLSPVGRPKLPLLIAAATLTGLLTGFFGVGGGFIVVPMLVIGLHLDMRRAAGTSLLVMIMSSAVSLIARIGTDVQIDWPLVLLFLAGSMAGSLLGGPLSQKARPSTLTLVFSGLLAAVGVFTLVETLVL